MKLTRIRIPALSIVVFLALSPMLCGQSTWNGSQSSVWNLAANWTGTVPTGSTDIVIPSGTPNAPSTAGVSGAACRDLTVNAGATLTCASGFRLDSSRNVTVAGAITGTGGLRLIGGATGNLGGGGTIGTSLEVAKTAGVAITLVSDVTAASFTLTTGAFVVSSPGVDTLTVTGNALFQGGSLLVPSFLGVIDVGGDVTFSGTAATGQEPSIRCAGNWTSDANFAPSSSGDVTFTGTVAHTISAAGSFRNLTIAAGAIMSASNLTVNGALVANGSLTLSGTLDANGNVTVGASGALDVGGGTDTFAGDVIATGPLTSTGTVVLDGGNGSLSAVSPLSNIQVVRPGGGVLLSGSFTASSFTLTSGTFSVSSPGAQTLTLTGNALFQGGVLQNSSFTGTIDVGGNVTFSGTVATGSLPFIRCAGNWTSDANFAPSSGEVTFDGTGAHTISAAGSFSQLTIAAGAIMTASNLTVNGALLADGSLSASGALDANGSVTVSATGALDVGGGTDTFAGSLNAIGPFTSTGTVVFDGSGGGSLSSASPLPNIQVARPGGGVTLAGSFTAGSFTLTSGTFAVSSPGAQTLTVTGNALFQGGFLETSGNVGTIDVAGNVTFAGTVATGSLPFIRCAGNWTFDANFAPVSGEVTLDGTSAHTISGAGSFRNLTIAAGAIMSASNLTVNGALVADGSLTLSGALDANGNVTVSAGGALDVGGGTDTFAGSLNAIGPFTSTGTVVFDGSGSGSVSSVSPLANIQVARPGGTVTLAGSFTTGSLTVTSGTFAASSPGAQTLTVTGNALFQGGFLEVSTNTGSIDILGNVTFSGTMATGSLPIIRCAGNWSADTNFAPVSGIVELNGTASTTIGAAVAGGTVSFSTLVIKNGLKTAANDFTIAAPSVTIDPTGSLTVTGGRHLSVHRPSVATSVAVNGPLTVAANGELSMGPQTTMTVGSTGTLSLVGTLAQPSKITGAAGGGYAAVVNGTLSASNFLVKEMGPAGFVVGLGATIANAPNNLANGTFDFGVGAAAGSVLLDLRRQAPAADFTGLTFLNTPGASGVFNVRTSSSGVPIGFTSYSGPLSGPSFENDPNGLITWNLQSAPPVGEFRVRLGAELVEILWHAANNTGIVGYEVRHSSSPSGPFTLVATQGVGNPGNGFVDVPLPANVPEWEAVWAVMSGGERMLFGVGTATPYSTNPPPNVYKVGANGPFASIQSAINAATAANSVVWVTPGNYASFTVGSSAPQNLHIAGDDTGPVTIDTSSGPITISNVAAGKGVELGGLSIGSASTAQPGVQVISCAGTIVLDALTVACNGSQTAVSVTGSPKVAIQRCAISGGTGLSIASASHVALSRGSLSSLSSTGSTIEMADLTPGSVSVSPAGSLVTRGGIMPNMVLNRFASMAHPQIMTIDAFPNTPYIPIASPTLSFTNLTGFEMPILVDPGYVFIFPTMMTDAAGHGVSPFEIEPALVLLGYTYVAQVACFDPTTGTLRMSNAVTVVSMP